MGQAPTQTQLHRRGQLRRDFRFHRLLTRWEQQCDVLEWFLSPETMFKFIMLIIWARFVPSRQGYVQQTDNGYVVSVLADAGAVTDPRRGELCRNFNQKPARRPPLCQRR